MHAFDKFSTSALLIMVLTFFIGYLAKQLPENFQKNIFGKLLLGLLGGVFSLLLLLYSYSIDQVTVLDLSGLILLTISAWGGIIPSILTVFFQIILQLFVWGHHYLAYTTIIQLFLSVLFFYIVDRNVTDRKKNWAYKTFFILMITNVFCMYIVQDNSEFPALFIYSSVFIIASILQYILVSSIQESCILFHQYKQDSTMDFLTGVMNRKYFDTALQESFQSAETSGKPLSCFMLDIDFFKKVNDTYGHVNGDIVLSEFASLITQQLPDNCSIGRVGGEEFCVLISDCGLAAAVSIAKELNQSIATHPIHLNDERVLQVTASIGVSCYPESVNQFYDLKEQADSALYNAKRSGRNRVCYR